MSNYKLILNDIQRNKLMACVDTQIRVGPGQSGGIYAAEECLLLAKLLVSAEVIEEENAKDSGQTSQPAES